VAAVFGALFVVQGILFVVPAARGSVSFGPPQGWRGILGSRQRPGAMRTRISPLWWPLLLAASPVLIPILIVQNSRFRKNASEAEQRNRHRLSAAMPLELPELEHWN
jgi:hypothetical protein